MNKFSTILKEPLYQFLLAGGLIFILSLTFNNQESSSQNIIITLADRQRLIATWQMQWKREPTKEELLSLIDSEIKEKIYYHEAIKLGLDKNDTIIRRRLMQKLAFVTEELHRGSEPSKQELIHYFEQNSKQYKLPSRYTFKHIYFSTDQHPDAFLAASRALERIKSGSEPSVSIAEIGDAYPFDSEFFNVDSRMVKREFGGGFTEQLSKLKVNQWLGPIQSGLGIHLVFLKERIEKITPAFTVIVDDVKRDFLYSKKQLDSSISYERMKKNYHIKVDKVEIEKAHPIESEE